MFACNGPYPAIENHILWLLINGFLYVKGLKTLFIGGTLGVKISLHHVIFPVHWRKSSGRLDQYQAIHPVGHVHPNGSGGAMVNVETGIQGFEVEGSLFPRSHK